MLMSSRDAATGISAAESARLSGDHSKLTCRSDAAPCRTPPPPALPWCLGCFWRSAPAGSRDWTAAGPFTAAGCALGAASGVAGVRGIGVTSRAVIPGAFDAQFVRIASVVSTPVRHPCLLMQLRSPGARFSVVTRLAPLALRLPAAVAVFAWYRVAVRCGWTVKVARAGGWKREVTAAPAGQRGRRLPTLLYDSCASLSCQ